MATIWEETKKQTSKMKGRPLKEKIAYIWEYYHIAILIAAGAIFIIVSLIRAFVNSKDYALSVVMVNSIAEALELTPEWTEDLTGILDFDQKEYEVYIDASIEVGGDTVTASQEYASVQKFAALLSSQSIDILTADTPLFEQYSQNEYLLDLRTAYSEDELKKYADIIYYTDAATYSDYDSNNDPSMDVNAKQASYVIDHHDPKSMKEPVPTGFFVTDVTKLGKSGAYALVKENDPYQGYPVETVIGIAVNSPRIDASKIGIDYFLSE